MEEPSRSKHHSLALNHIRLSDEKMKRKSGIQVATKGSGPATEASGPPTSDYASHSPSWELHQARSPTSRVCMH